MTVNLSAPLSYVCKPRGIVVINGTQLDAARVLEEFDVEQNAYYVADRFSAKLVVSTLPAAFDANFWSGTDSIAIEFRISFLDESDNPINVSSLLVGRVDETELDIVGNCLTIHGRDRTADLIETKITEKYVNKTSSQIATILAQEHGLTPNVTATSIKVGQYYEGDSSNLQSETTEWDLLTYLAQQETDFVTYVTGTTLYFGPKPQASDDAYQLTWVPPTADDPIPKGNFVDLRLSRNLTLAKDITVIVRWFNQKTSKSDKVTVKATGAKRANNVAGIHGQTFFYRLSNVTKDQALRYGHARLAELTQHERVVTATIPGDPLLTMQTPVNLTGTGTAWDQVYFPDTITHRYGLHEGYLISLRAKNHSPESTVGI